jgi:hypothetical protein
MTNKLRSKLISLLEDRSGAVTVTAALWIGFVAIALAGLGVDGANLYRVKNALQQSSNRAAVAGAEQLSVSQSSATSTAKQYSSDTAALGLNRINNISVTSTVSASCVWSLLPGDPTSATTCPGTGANVVTVSQTATVNTFFGFGSKTITVTSAAAANGATGGVTADLDVVIILDTTASMKDCENGTNGCSGHAFAAPISCPAVAPSWASTSSKMQAAELAVQTLLCSFTPATSSTATTGTRVALMTFPGVSNPAVEYCGTSGSVTTVPYNTVTNAQYLIVPFSYDFRTSASASALNQNSNLVKAMGGNSSCAGMQDPGGQSTYYGGVLSAAQAYLTANGRTGTQKVIFLLSDGDAQASTGPANQCQQAVTNADAAATAGTWVFSVAYNAMTSGTCSKDSGTYKGSACKAMQNVASSPGTEPDSSKFFAYNGTGSGANCTSTNVSLPTLAATFKAALQSFTAARLVNVSCVTGTTCKL